MQLYSEWKRDQHTKTIIVTCRDKADTLENLIKFIKSSGNAGHTFTIDVDGKKFEWDGDGSDAIFDIECKKPGLKLALNIEGEPEEVG